MAIPKGNHISYNNNIPTVCITITAGYCNFKSVLHIPGLVGKSTFLDLKLENEGAMFLGEWFGEGKVDIALQAFLVMDGPVHARVSTTKFVKIPKGGEKDFRMAVKVVKDLREGTEPISATLKATKVTTNEWYTPSGGHSPT